MADTETTPILVIGNKNYSSWSLRPWLLLTQLGIPFTEVRLPLDTPEFAEKIGQWSPTGRVPVLRHGRLTVWDSFAICEYVNDVLAPGRGWPADPPTRAHARSVCAEMHAGFMALRNELPMNCRARGRRVQRSAACEADLQRIYSSWRVCRQHYGDGGPWLFGAFSIADAMYAPVALRLLTYDVSRDAVVQAYIDALLALPALQAWLAAAQAETEVVEADEAGETDPARS